MVTILSKTEILESFREGEEASLADFFGRFSDGYFLWIRREDLASDSNILGEELETFIEEKEESIFDIYNLLGAETYFFNDEKVAAQIDGDSPETSNVLAYVLFSESVKENISTSRGVYYIFRLKVK
jgi:hypothetical protein